MTEEALRDFLAGRPLWEVIDVKTLVLDRVRQSTPAEFEALFHTLLPQLTPDALQDASYMQRP